MNSAEIKAKIEEAGGISCDECFWLAEIAYQLAVMNERAKVRDYRPVMSERAQAASSAKPTTIDSLTAIFRQHGPDIRIQRHPSVPDGRYTKREWNNKPHRFEAGDPASGICKHCDKRLVIVSADDGSGVVQFPHLAESNELAARVEERD